MVRMSVNSAIGFLLATALVPSTGRLIGGECPWGCIPIKQCDLIFRDLVTANTARERGRVDVVDKIVGLVRQYICDERAEQVCCPEFIGTFNNSLTLAGEAVYAVDRNTIALRTKWPPEGWQGTEAFFWRRGNEDCF